MSCFHCFSSQDNLNYALLVIHKLIQIFSIFPASLLLHQCRVLLFLYMNVLRLPLPCLSWINTELIVLCLFIAKLWILYVSTTHHFAMSHFLKTVCLFSPTQINIASDRFSQVSLIPYSMMALLIFWSHPYILSIVSANKCYMV